jgi:hypothetical protein
MIEEILAQASRKKLVIGFFGVWGIIWLSRVISTERKLRTLGGHTKRIKTWLPYGL